ncbi:hypothetical protein SJ059_31155, partial [Klebsiella aerogenes]|nr:hypothetical protein [Klebsiella aerogenes]
YPLAGTLGTAIGLQATGFVLVAIGVIGAGAALLAWRDDAEPKRGTKPRQTKLRNPANRS